jgi:hypothetical protein
MMMTLTIDVPPAAAARFEEAARRRGVEVTEYVQQWLEEHAGAIDTESYAARGAGGMSPGVSLFAEWDAEDAALSPEQRKTESDRWDEFKRSINDERDRAGARRVF